MMSKLKAQLTALGTAATLVFTSVAVDVKPAVAGTDELIGGAIGGIIGSILSRGGSSGSGSHSSSSDVHKALKRVMMHHGLTPMDSCTVNSVSVMARGVEVCAMPNHIYSPGTYKVNPMTYELVAYGVTAPPQTQQPVYPQTQHPVYPQTQQPVYPQTQHPVYPQTQQPVYPQTQQPVYANLNSMGYQGPILSLNGQPISPPVLARLRALVSSHNIAEANCGATPNQVVLNINNQYMVCGHPTQQYSPGVYRVNTATFF